LREKTVFRILVFDKMGGSAYIDLIDSISLKKYHFVGKKKLSFGHSHFGVLQIVMEL